MEKTFRRFGASVILATIAVVSCAPVPGATPIAPTLEPIAPTTTTSVDAPFVYRIGVLEGLTTANFWAFQGEETTVWNAYILGPTKPSLYSLHPISFAPLPELASHHQEPAEHEGKWTVEVELNQHLAWSDGTPITAADIVFTYETVRRLNLGGAWAESFPSTLTAIHANALHRVTIEFGERPSLAVWPHGVGLAPIMPAHVWAEAVAGVTSPAALYQLGSDRDVGGGSLRIHSVSPEKVVSVSNPGYTIGSSPDVVEYVTYVNEEAAIHALNSGDIDSILSPKGLNREQLALVDPEEPIRVVENAAHGVRYIGFNLDREPMSDPAFRTALALILDRDLNSFVAKANLLWHDAEAASGIDATHPVEPAERFQIAISLLREAGYTWDTEPAFAEGGIVPGIGLAIGGVEPPALSILTPGDAWDPTRPIYASEIARTLKAIGFRAMPVETDFATVAELAFTPGNDGSRRYDMYILGWTLGSPSLPGYHRVFFAADGILNNTGYASAEFEEGLVLYEGAFANDEARRALWALEEILARDLPYLLLYPTTITEVYRSDRVAFEYPDALGGLQGRLGGIGDVKPAGVR